MLGMIARLPRVGLLAVAVAGTAACDARRAEDGPPGEPASLPMETLAAGDAFGVPADLLVHGENLVVVDPMADSAVHVLRLRDGATVRRLGRRGDGPGEFRGIWNASPGGEDPSRFRVFDAAHVRVTTVDLDAPEIGSTAAIPGVPVYQLHVVDDTLAFALVTLQ